MDRINILKYAEEQINGTRVENYGTPENNFQVIADFWTTYLSNKYSVWFRINATDVALMQDLLKTARLIKAPNHKDSWADKIGYSACGAEVSNA